MLRLALWVGTFAMAVLLDRLFLGSLPVWLQAPLLVAAIGVIVAGLSGLALPGERLLLADVGVEAVKGVVMGIILAVALTVASALFKWSPGVLVPAMVWPTVTLWPSRHKV